MPFIIISRFADVGVEKRSKEEEKVRRTREEESFSILINETWSVADRRVATKDDQVPDLHTFWKGEGNATSIREARGEYLIVEHYLRALSLFSFFLFLSLSHLLKLVAPTRYSTI